MHSERKLHFLGNRQIIIVFILSAFLSFSLFYFLFYNASPRVYVVDNQKMFDNFRMTKEAKIKGEQLLKAQKIKLDSLKVQFTVESNDLIKSQIYDQISYQEEGLRNFNQNYTQEETSKIWKRIQGYMKDFAELKEYELIIGSQENGDVWHNNPKNDITDEALNYINKKYEGLN